MNVQPLARGRNTRVFKAILAEDYDGMGQYVWVALTRNSATPAIRARIACGDFNTGTSYPEGTPVVTFSDHGQLEILGLGMKFLPFTTESDDEAS